MRDRAWRRAQRHRWIARASRTCMYAAWLRATAPEHRANVRGRAAKTRVPCSCYMCGNPRRHGWKPSYALTLAERRAMEAV